MRELFGLEEAIEYMKDYSYSDGNKYGFAHHITILIEAANLAQQLARGINEEWVSAPKGTCFTPQREPLRKALAKARAARLLEGVE